jgi:hypothetical protein
MPAYVHTTLTTGISISGKMSTGIRSASAMPSSVMRISRETTV